MIHIRIVIVVVVTWLNSMNSSDVHVKCQRIPNSLAKDAKNILIHVYNSTRSVDLLHSKHAIVLS